MIREVRSIGLFSLLIIVFTAGSFFFISFFCFSAREISDAFNGKPASAARAKETLFFLSETTGDYILKVNAKRITDFDALVLKDTYKANVSLAGYSFNDNKGFYAKIDKISPTNYNKMTELQKIINIYWLLACPIQELFRTNF